MKKGKLSKYSTSMKIAIAKEWLKGEKGYLRLANEYGIPSRYTVRDIVYWYKKNYDEYSELVPIGLTEEELADNAALRKELVILQIKLSEASLKIDALNVTISVAEENYKIEIRKKSGSKQQTK